MNDGGRLIRSALRLPRRLAHALHVGLGIVGWALTFRLRAGLRTRRHARLLRRSALFDVPFYLAQCGDDRAARRDPCTHYLVRGAGRGLAPSPFFDGAAYLARNPAAAGENPLVHHLLAEHARAVARTARGSTPAPPSRPPAPSVGEALLLANPFRSPPDGGPRRVLVIDGDGHESGGASPRAAVLVRLARSVGPVTLACERAAAGAEDADILRSFAATVAHLACEGERYSAVIVQGPEQAARYLAAVRAYATHATLICDAAGAVPRDPGSREPQSLAPRQRTARVALACCDVVLVAGPAEREAALRLAPGARVEVLPRAVEAIEEVLAPTRRADSARLAGGAA